MLAWLLAFIVAFAPAAPLFAQEDGGGSQNSEGEGGNDESGGPQPGMPGGDEGGGEEGGAQGGQQGGEEGGGDQGGGDQGGGDESGGPQPGQPGGDEGQQGGDASSDSSGGEDSGVKDGEASVNIVGDIAADDGSEEMAASRKPSTKKAKVSKKKVPAAKGMKGRLSRRRRGAAASPVGAPAAPTGEAEPQFPELDLPEMKTALAKKEPAPPTAPMVPLPLAFP